MQRKLQLTKKEIPEFIPVHLVTAYDQTDVEYHPFFTSLCANLESKKRDNFPPETIRGWYLEMLQRGWTRHMVLDRYRALLDIKIYGVERIDWADWVHAVPVIGVDEANLRIDREINFRITNGRAFLNLFLNEINHLFEGKDIVLTKEEKKNIALAALQKAKEQQQAARFRMIDEEIEKQKKIFQSRILRVKKIIKSLSQEEKKKILNRALDEKIIIAGTPQEYTIALTYLEMYAEKIPEDYLDKIKEK
jgi:hypothetical protein